MQFVRSADELLIRGIGDYTYQPGEDGIVGKGKFSTVYKVRGIKGEIVSAPIRLRCGMPRGVC